jgi:serine/threonine protein phosphatase PrpC
MPQIGGGAIRLRVTWCGRTVTGQVRRNNEDTLWAAPVAANGALDGDSEGTQESRHPGLLFAVADGMGGALAGEVASGLAVRTLAAEMTKRFPPGKTPGDAAGATSSKALADSVEAANLRIRAEGESNPQRRGMGSTLTAVWVVQDGMFVAQVGDSRAYLFRAGHLQQLTKDQSLVGKLIEDGIITEEEAERIAGRNIILQALGGEEPLDVALQSLKVQAGDTILLCSDGLSGVVNNRDLEEDLRKGGRPDEVCSRLIELAEGRGGPDNITVVVARLELIP